MARRRTRRFNRKKRNLVWVTRSFGVTKNMTEGTHNQIIQVSGAEDNLEYTIKRVRGMLVVGAGSSGSPDVSFGLVSGIVLPDILVGTPTTGTVYPDNFPHPLDDDGTDDWMIFSPFMAAANSSTSSGDETVPLYSGMREYGFDSKAQRRLGRDESLWIGLAILRGETIFRVDGIIRVLMELRT